MHICQNLNSMILYYQMKETKTIEPKFQKLIILHHLNNQRGVCCKCNIQFDITDIKPILVWKEPSSGKDVFFDTELSCEPCLNENT